ncbi:hypothetical protein L596_005984 [Steinernema carpocapsae]|uniref:Uncharacterized protein n=1 Tax=Steinernema carpocapsae TaxID=34508 RepID=A0A4U8V7D9_STECR|nr:hypothetical protein L596_005984 [Steinernema carpocapsae]
MTVNFDFLVVAISTSVYFGFLGIIVRGNTPSLAVCQLLIVGGQPIDLCSGAGDRRVVVATAGGKFQPQTVDDHFNRSRPFQKRFSVQLLFVRALAC